MENIEVHVRKMEKTLAQWGAKLDELAAKADEAGAAVETDYRKRIDDFKAKYHVAQTKLDQLKAGGSDKWETVKDGIESAWKELEFAYKKLTN